MHGNRFVPAALALTKHRQVVDVEIDVGCDEEIEIAVMIVIDKEVPSGPARVVYSSCVGNVSERTVAVVLQQMIRAEAGDVKIFEAVVIVIAGRGAHAPTDIAHASFH